MEDLIVKVANKFQKMPDEVLADKDLVIATCFVKAVNCFSNINKILLRSRSKPLTDAKLEDVGRELSLVLFYLSCLINVRELPTDGFDYGSLVDFCSELDPIYQQDAIMASSYGIKSLTDLVDIIYLNADIEVEVDPNQISVVEALSEDLDETGEDNVTEEESCVASIFAACILLCDRLNMDIDNLCFNAVLTEKL